MLIREVDAAGEDEGDGKASGAGRIEVRASTVSLRRSPSPRKGATRTVNESSGC